MVRKKSYDRSQAINRAMHAFWAKGFSNLGVREIGRETGINRFALQTEFGGKQGLFTETLNAYLTLSKAILKPLEDGGLRAITVFFRELTTGVDGDPRNAGCLMVNTVIENADMGMEAVREITCAHYDNMQRMFESALETARTTGEVDEDFDIPGAAVTLLTVAMGIEVFVRMKGNVNAARSQGDFIIHEIEGWRS